MSQEYVSHEYVSHEYVSHEYVSQEYVSQEYVTQEYVSQEYVSQEYVSHGGVSAYQSDAAADGDAGFSGRRSLIKLHQNTNSKSDNEFSFLCFFMVSTNF